MKHYSLTDIAALAKVCIDNATIIIQYSFMYVAVVYLNA